MPGPAPKANPVRRNARTGPLQLPAEGRQGPPPPWPLDTRFHADDASDEAAAWAELWATPQAVAWERLGWTRTVARYCRVMVVAESLDKDALSEARQLEDRLGLTPKAMRMLLWEVVADETADRRTGPKSKSARSRIKAVG